MEASSAMPSEMMGAGKMTAAKMSTTTTTMEMGVTAAVPTMTTAVTPTMTATMTPTMTATMTAASRKRGAG